MKCPRQKKRKWPRQGCRQRAYVGTHLWCLYLILLQRAQVDKEQIQLRQLPVPVRLESWKLTKSLSLPVSLERSPCAVPYAQRPAEIKILRRSSSALSLESGEVQWERRRVSCMRRLPSTSEEEAWSVLAKINKTVINFCNITVTHYHDHDHVHLYRSGESTIIIITVNVMIGVLGYVLLRLSHQLWKSSLWPNKHSFMESLLNNWPWAPGLSTYLP